MRGLFEGANYTRARSNQGNTVIDPIDQQFKIYFANSTLMMMKICVYVGQDHFFIST